MAKPRTRIALKNLQLLRVDAGAVLREIRADPDQTMVGAMILNSGYTDDVVITIACVLNEIASRAAGQRYPMAEDDLLNAVDLLDGLSVLNMQIKATRVRRETQEPEPSI